VRGNYFSGDPMILGYVLVTVEIGHNSEVREALSKVSGVEEIYSVYGVYDIILKIVADSKDELNNVIKSGIRQIENIDSAFFFVDSGSFGVLVSSEGDVHLF